MPALIHFHRKWLIACDDFVIPSAIETVIRVIWLIPSVIITWFHTSGCNADNLYATYLLYIIAGDYLLTTLLCIAISVISSRGAVLQAEKRIHLPKILYIKCITVLFEIAIIGFSAWFLQRNTDLCSQWKIFIKASIALLSLYVFGVVVGVFVSYNSLGSSFYWNTKSKVDSTQITKKVERKWRLRLKFFCCCADVSDDENDFVYVEISSFLATFSNDIDLAPTDILAGLMTVSKKHALEKRKLKWPKHTDALLASKPTPTWMTAENALHFLRIAKSTYGWVAFFNLLYPWKLCTLFSPSRCCQGMFEENSTKHGDCCYCNTSAMEKITGLPDTDILYASFSNSVYEPAFIVAFDHSKEVVVVAIRGTCSFSDLMTDIDLDEMNFPVQGTSTKLKCHRGALRSALFIYKRIHELQVLKTAFNEHSSYTLVITGHSLGGSAAAILSMLLRPEYPSLQCYAFAPLATLSEEGITKTLDFIFSVVVGDDIVPRLSAYSFKELIKQICVSLEETKLPKYKILSRAFWRYVKKSCNVSKKVLSPSEVYENKEIETKDELPLEISESVPKSEQLLFRTEAIGQQQWMKAMFTIVDQSVSSRKAIAHFWDRFHLSESRGDVHVDIIPNEAQLYAPGRILYLRRLDRYDYSWVTGYYFQNIIISPSVIKDHQPHKIQLMLEKYKSELLPVQQQPSHTEII